MLNVFELQIGQKVKHMHTGQVVTITSVRETQAECVGAFYELDGHEVELETWNFEIIKEEKRAS